MAHFKISSETRQVLFGLMVIMGICCFFYFIHSLRLNYIAKTPKQNGSEVVLSPLNPQSFGLKVVFLYEYKEYSRNKPWYVSVSRDYYNQRIIIVNQRSDSAIVNIERLKEAHTQSFHTLKFQDSLLVSVDKYHDTDAVNIWSLSGGKLGWVGIKELW